MNESKHQQAAHDEVWAQRQKNNVRIGYALGALAVVIFVIALLTYRPL